MTYITNLERKFEMEQPKEQTGFRKKYSTIEHLHTIRQLIEYNIQLRIAFIDLKNMFGSLEPCAMIAAMKNARTCQR